jgi:hypothetical protein
MWPLLGAVRKVEFKLGVYSLGAPRQIEFGLQPTL